jgi:signal transduction histidine kinase
VIVWLRSFVLALLIFFSLATQGSSPPPDGRVDVSMLSFDETAPYPLFVQWEFYWNKLLSPSDFGMEHKPEYLYPVAWNRQGNYEALGYGTYRLRLRFSGDQRSVSLYFPIINSAAKIFVNGRMAEQSGIVNADRKLYKARLSSTLVTIPDGVRDVDVIVQVVNYSYFSGGMVRTPILQKTSALFRDRNQFNGIEDFFAGSLMAMFIYQLILYFLYHRGRPYLWLALICLAVAARALVTHGGSFLLPHIFTNVDWEFWKKLEFGSVYAVVAFFPLYVYDLFKEHAPRWPIYLFVTIASVLCTAVVFTPQYVYGLLLDVCHISLLLTFVYAFYSIARAWRKGNTDARVILIGVLTSFPFFVIEILKNSLLYSLNIHFMYLVELGVLVFLLFQVYLLSHHYAKSYQKLETVNQDLEKMVTERTGQLVTANRVKDRLLSVMSHDIKSPLNSLRGILQIFNMGAITPAEFGTFARQVENDLNNTSLLVENILYWTASQLKGVQVKVEKFDLRSLIEENIRLFQTVASNKKVTLQHNVLSVFEITSDRNILNLVLRNLMANALKFSNEGGTVDIIVSRNQQALLIQVKDQGIGMSEETLRKLMEPDASMSQEGTAKERGTGLGLALCREYLQSAGGSLHVESELGKGTCFTILLP